jgi:hypothetical protein
MILDIKQEKCDLERMPDALLAEMFHTGIVVIPEEFAPQEEPVATSMVQHEESPSDPIKTATEEMPNASDTVVWLGNFSRQVLVVVNDPAALHLNDADFALLGKILGAVKLSVADIAVVNVARHNLQYETLNHLLPAKVAIYFGVEPVSIGVPFKVPMFQVQPWNQTKFLYAPSLKELNVQSPEAVSLKKSLWEALKKIFD